LSSTFIVEQPTVREVAACLQHAMTEVAASHPHTAGPSSLPRPCNGCTQTLAAVPLAQRHGHILTTVLRIIHDLTGANFDEQTDLVNASFDSLMATELAIRLRDVTGCATSPMLVVEQPTASAVAAHLLQIIDLTPSNTPSTSCSDENFMLASAHLAISEIRKTRCHCILHELKHLAGISPVTPGPVALRGEEQHKRDVMATLLELGLASEAYDMHREPEWLLVGDSALRCRLAQDTEGVSFATVVHPSARVHHSATVGVGSFVSVCASMGPDCKIGQHCMVGVMSGIAHDCVVGDFVTIGRCVIINGGCILEDGCTIEDYAILRPNVRIGRNALVRAASTVLRDVPASITVAGIPALNVSATAMSDSRRLLADGKQLLAADSSINALRREMDDFLLLRMAKEVGSPSRSKWTPPVAGVLGTPVTTVGLVGAGGFGKMTLQFFSELTWEGVYDDRSELETFQSVKVKGRILDAPHKLPLVLSIGTNGARRAIVGRYPNQTWATLIHPTADVAADASIGVGTIIEPYAVISPGAKVGAFAFVGMYAFLGHNVTIDDFTFVASTSVVASGCTISSSAVVGAGALICPNIHVGAASTIVMGSLVGEDVADNFVAQGAPASLVFKRSAALLH